MSSLGSRRVREEFKRPSRPGSQATSRTGPRTCGRACTGRTRAAAHAPPRRPPRARSRSAPPEQRALRCGLSGRRPAGREEGRARRRGARAARPGGAGTVAIALPESPSDGKAGRRGATAFERRAGEQNAAPPCASFCSNFTGTSKRYAWRRNHFVLGVFTISSVIAPSGNPWGQFCCGRGPVPFYPSQREVSVFIYSSTSNGTVPS